MAILSVAPQLCLAPVNGWATVFTPQAFQRLTVGRVSTVDGRKMDIADGEFIQQLRA